MRWRSNAGRAVAIGALAAIVGIGGCQEADSGGWVETRAPETSTSTAALPRASAVTVTYYYLPG